MNFGHFERETSEALLDRVKLWWAARQDVANRPRIALDNWLELSPPERNAAWQVEIDAVRSVKNLNDVRIPIWILSRRQLGAAIPLFADLWRRCAVQPIRAPAGDALFEIGRAHV